LTNGELTAHEALGMCRILDVHRALPLFETLRNVTVMNV